MLNRLKALGILIFLSSAISCGNDITTTDNNPTVEQDAANPEIGKSIESLKISSSDEGIDAFSINPQNNLKQYKKPLLINKDGEKIIDFKILSLNTWGVPSILGYNVSKFQKERFKNISTIINGYDVVNLQETFSKNAKIIVDAVDYPSKLRYNNSSFLKIGSGLTTFSKYPIVSNKFVKFNTCTGSDCFSNKGVLMVRINVPGIGDVDIFNTHYNAIDRAENIRVNDNVQFYDLFKQNDVGNPTIISGDFNFKNLDMSDTSSLAYLNFKKMFNPVDTFRLKNPSEPGFSYDNTINNFASEKDPRERFDYIFNLPENRNPEKPAKYRMEVLESKIMFNQPVNGKFLSDHFGLTTTFRFHILP